MLWETPEFRVENIGPDVRRAERRGRLSQWEPTFYAADWQFGSEIAVLQFPPIFLDEVVALVALDRRSAAVRYAERARRSTRALRSRQCVRTRLRQIGRGLPTTLPGGPARCSSKR